MEEYNTLHENTNLKMMDTAGNEDYEKLRSTAYSGVNVFLVVFSIDHHRAFERLKYWVKKNFFFFFFLVVKKNIKYFFFFKF